MLLVTDKELKLKASVEEWAHSLATYAGHLIEGANLQRDTNLNEPTWEIQILNNIVSIANSIQIGTDKTEKGEALWILWKDANNSLNYNRESADRKADKADIVFSLMKFGMALNNLLSVFSKRPIGMTVYSYTKSFNDIMDEYMGVSE